MGFNGKRRYKGIILFLFRISYHTGGLVDNKDKVNLGEVNFPLHFA